MGASVRAVEVKTMALPLAEARAVAMGAVVSGGGGGCREGSAVLEVAVTAASWAEVRRW